MNQEIAARTERKTTTAIACLEVEQRQQTASLTPADLVKEQIADIRLAAAKMAGSQRRSFMGEMALKYCSGSARLTESIFKWSRDAIATGLGENRTGILCIGLQAMNNGNDRWEDKHPEIAEFLCKIAENQSQQDPTFESTIAYTRLTAPSALKALREAGFREDDLPSRSSMVDILDRLSYRLRKVVKAKPLKKVKETDAIFENIKKKDQEVKSADEHIIRISMDCKATVKLGELSRGGLSRGDNKACDHDFISNGSHTPCGIVNEDSGQLYINMGCSYKTSDFIIDTLKGWWKSIPLNELIRSAAIQLKVDNGPESSGMRTQFLKRIVEFSDDIGKAIQLLYYPPYHSKYNPIERCWGILELHWNGTLLKDVHVMTKWAKTMTWKGIHPIVEVSTTIYEKGISLTKSAMRAVEKRLERDPVLPKWSILIKPAVAI